jgi:hypothetical protein
MSSFSRGSVRVILLSVVFAALAIFLSPRPGSAQVPMRTYDATLKQMLDAIQSKSYDRFVAEGDASFKTGFTQKMFEDLAGQLGQKLQKGHRVSFLTTLNQQDFVIYIWKLMLKGVRDEYLINLFVRDGNVIGFIIR